MEASQTAIERLRQMMNTELERLGLTLREASRKTKLPFETFLMGDEEGLRPSVNRAEQICRALGLTMMIGVGTAPKTDSARMAQDSTKTLQWTQAIVYRVEGANGRRYEVELRATTAGRPRWHVLATDPWRIKLERKRATFPLGGAKGGVLQNFADVEQAIESYERDALGRDRSRQAVYGEEPE